MICLGERCLHEGTVFAASAFPCPSALRSLTENAYPVWRRGRLYKVFYFYFVCKENMTSEERRKGRRERRIARREEKRKASFVPFEAVVDPDNLHKAFKRSRKEVAWKESVQRYEMNLFRNLNETVRKLLAGEDVTKGFVEFDLWERGRLRHIKSVHISERVVQKCLCTEVLIPAIVPTLIYDNSATVKDKGLHFAVRRLVCHLSKFYRKNNFSNDGYCLSIDFSKYFDRVRHDLLFEMQGEIIRDERTMKILMDFVKPFGDGVSLGLGSEVSQISAIFYPSGKLDHFVKEKLRIKYYGRYMDDLYIIHKSREFLVGCLEKIKAKCAELGIMINEKKTRIIKLSDGIRFLKGVYSLAGSGKIVHRALPASRKLIRRKLVKFMRFYRAGKMQFPDIRCSYQSWRGNYLKRYNAYHTVRRMDGFFNRLFVF